MNSINDAISWAEARWDGQRTPPIRLHRAHATDGALGAPAMTHAFERMLDESPAAAGSVTVSTLCGHPNRPHGAICAMCAIYDGQGRPIAESGVYERTVARYRYPMTLALDKLSNTLRPRRQPHPYALILTLASHGWDWRASARSLDMGYDLAEASFLRALRQLHSRYQEAPIGYLAKSESHQHAEALAS